MTSIRIRTARKAHICEARGIFGNMLVLADCNAPIHPGEQYAEVPDPDDPTTMSRRHYCLVCAARKGLIQSRPDIGVSVLPPPKGKALDERRCRTRR